MQRVLQGWMKKVDKADRSKAMFMVSLSTRSTLNSFPIIHREMIHSMNIFTRYSNTW